VIANGIPSEPISVQVGAHRREDGLAGKVESLTYDSFGDFESFTFETLHGQMRRFESREPHLEEVVKRAWQDRMRVRIVAEAHHSHRVSSISLLGQN
jgi:hypothetical protein